MRKKNKGFAPICFQALLYVRLWWKGEGLGFRQVRGSWLGFRFRVQVSGSGLGSGLGLELGLEFRV